jgi:hypothetical protein
VEGATKAKVSSNRSSLADSSRAPLRQATARASKATAAHAEADFERF